MNNNKQTIKIKCRNCGNEFEFTGGEQTFYEEKGFAVPVRCKECRNARKLANAEKEVPTTKSETFTESKPDFEDMLDNFKANTVYFDSKKDAR